MILWAYVTRCLPLSYLHEIFTLTGFFYFPRVQPDAGQCVYLLTEFVPLCNTSGVHSKRYQYRLHISGIEYKIDRWVFIVL